MPLFFAYHRNRPMEEDIEVEKSSSNSNGGTISPSQLQIGRTGSEETVRHIDIEVEEDKYQESNNENSSEMMMEEEMQEIKMDSGSSAMEAAAPKTGSEVAPPKKTVVPRTQSCDSCRSKKVGKRRRRTWRCIGVNFDARLLLDRPAVRCRP